MDAGYFLNPNGTFNFYSYRDPHTLQTYENFELAIHTLLNYDLR